MGLSLRRRLRPILNYWKLNKAGRKLLRAELNGQMQADPGPQVAAELGMQWLATAQDRSASRDGGVARDYSYLHGWASSYPETTGYIIPTILAFCEKTSRTDYESRAKQMLDWLLSIQYPDGGFQGGVAGTTSKAPVVFNTGQILIGLSAGAQKWGAPYVNAAERAVDWLVSIQDTDGQWSRFQSPFAKLGPKAYDAHTAWGLFEAARVLGLQTAGAAGMRNIRHVLTLQLPNGWIDHCCLTDITQPLTHTLGYAIRGMLEAHRYSRAPEILAASERSALAMTECVRQDGFLPGRLNRQWRGTVEWACLTGSLQMACCWFWLYQLTGNALYLHTARRVNRFVRCTILTDSDNNVRGGIRGSYPLSGGYCSYSCPNWATKFMVDAQLLELQVA